jgi:HTH-type transcriptional regulator/antitoxin HigA
MAKIKDEKQYDLITQRIEEILKLSSNEEPTPEYILAELDVLGGLAEEYEAEHFPLTPPALPEILRYKMDELNISQTETAKIIGISPSRVSEFMSGKAEPTLPIARKMVVNLGISPAMMLGVAY